MVEYIEKKAVLALKQKIGAYGMDISSEDVKKLPAADVVSRATFEQVMWERDVAIQQLKDLGVGFGEKADVAPVVHENCKFCGGNNNAFHVINGETVAYSGIEIAINRQGMLRVRTYDDYNNRTALPKSTEIVMIVACPNCGAKMDGDRG